MYRYREFKSKLSDFLLHACLRLPVRTRTQTGARTREAMGEPLDGSPEVHGVQVHRQVDRATAAVPLVPVDELHAADRQHALGGMPLGLVAAIRFGADGA